MDFLLNSIVWILAIYGLFEIIKTIIAITMYSKISDSGLYMIIATKNQENCIEPFLRSILFRIIYGKEEYISNLIVTDLNSVDSTFNIEEKLSKDYGQIKLLNWEECKSFFDKLNKENWLTWEIKKQKNMLYNTEKYV